MDFSRWTREKSIIAPSVKKYRVYVPIGGVKKRNYTPDGKKVVSLLLPDGFCPNGLSVKSHRHRIHQRKTQKNGNKALVFFSRPVYNSSYSPPYRDIYTILFDTAVGAVMDFSRVEREESIIARLEI